MKSKYFVIADNGNIFDPEEYLKREGCSYEMSVCIRREVLNEQWEVENGSEYIKLANKLGFSWEDNSKIGFLNYDYKADLIKRLVEGFARNLVNSIGMPIYEVRGSNFFDLKHPVVEAYAELFGDRLFKSNGMVMGYDASYPQFNLASKMNLQRADLPFAHFSISDCYRYEQRGECMILYRGRRFFMPDIHPYFADVSQAWEWYPILEEKLQKSFELVGKKYLNIAKISSMKNWEQYKAQVIDLAKKNQREILVDIRLDDSEKYWIVDIDYGVIDKFEQFREIGCIQIDVGNAERLGIEYEDANGEIKYPVIIHSAIPGGIERYIYMMIDNFDHFPIEFAPIQLRLIPVSEKFVDYALKVVERYDNLRIDIDDRDESVSKRIKMAHKEKIPKIVVVGDKEASQGLEIDEIDELEDSIKSLVPKLSINWPKLLSIRLK